MSAFDQNPQQTSAAAPAAAPAPTPNPEADAANARANALEQRLSQMEQVIQQSDAKRKTDARNQQLAQRGQEYESKVGTSKTTLDAAEAKLRQAYADESEPADIARAQREISVAAAELTRAESELTNFKAYVNSQKNQPAAEPAPAQQADPTNLQQWKAKNSWYETDGEMTATANQVDQELRARGDIPVGSLAYFDEIDRKVREKHADKFNVNPGQEGGQGMPTLSSGRGEGPASPTGGLRMDRSMQQAAERMGLTPEQWAKGRASAVDKGILTKDPVHARVI